MVINNETPKHNAYKAGFFLLLLLFLSTIVDTRHGM